MRFHVTNAKCKMQNAKPTNRFASLYLLPSAFCLLPLHRSFCFILTLRRLFTGKTVIDFERKYAQGGAVNAAADGAEAVVRFPASPVTLIALHLQRNQVIANHVVPAVPGIATG